ncbi:sulfur carrier protein ThiS [bacterium]|nr:sulfur carrier protein ThiS [candidate division CSSED10-310 bacterium]
MITINNRDTRDWRPGITVRDLLNEMGYVYVLITVTVNGELIDDNEYDSFEIPDGSFVRAIHIHHGG